MTDNAVRLTYPQYRAVRRLVHDCCNYDGGNCLLLDDGEECVCPQAISFSLICRWFRAAVLPLDESLCAALLYREDMKKCVLLIKHGRSITEKRIAASNLKRHLERCLEDMNLSDLTAIYKGLKEDNDIGYNPPAVAQFVTRLANRYPKP